MPTLAWDLRFKAFHHQSRTPGEGLVSTYVKCLRFDAIAEQENRNRPGRAGFEASALTTRLPQLQRVVCYFS